MIMTGGEKTKAKPKIIFHVDVNSAYLSWEAAYRIHHLGEREDLRETASAVGGDAALRRGIILAKSIPAKRYKIQTGETITEALRKCPTLKLVSPDYELYERCSAALIGVLKSYSPAVEQYSIDEAFVDMTETAALWGGAYAAAERMRRQIREELGFTVNIGISENKLLAKMAGELEKPDRIHTLWHDEIEEKMWGLPVRELFFVGAATERKLKTLGIETVGQLARSDRELLKWHMKKHGELIWAFANGIDVSLVLCGETPNKGYGNSTTTAFDVTDASVAKLVLLALSETVAARLRAEKVRAEVVAVGIRTCDFRYSEHQRTLKCSTDITREIHRCACGLFDELWDGTPIRHLGIRTGRIKDGTDIRQMELFDTTDYDKLKKADKVIDTIRGRYGIDSVKRAVFTVKGLEINHMEGGTGRKTRGENDIKMKDSVGVQGETRLRPRNFGDFQRYPQSSALKSTEISTVEV